MPEAPRAAFNRRYPANPKRWLCLSHRCVFAKWMRNQALGDDGRFKTVFLEG